LKFQGTARPEKSPRNSAFAAFSGAVFCSSGAAVFACLSAQGKSLGRKFAANAATRGVLAPSIAPRCTDGRARRLVQKAKGEQG